MCPPPRMEQEARFLEALAKAECWRIDDDARLVLADAAGTPLIVFEREQT
ncbi:MAG: META domain-containing protein [Defluviicoccus sp.]|nr:MAG: META domain-containing protein [Defluviicoccus sp.]